MDKQPNDGCNSLLTSLTSLSVLFSFLFSFTGGIQLKVFPFERFRTRSAPKRYGEHVRVNRCLKCLSNHGNPIGQRQPVTSSLM